MDIYSLEKSGPTKKDPSAVGFFFNGEQIFHVGIWFLEDPAEGPKFLHLARHHALRTDVPPKGFWIRLGLTERQMRFLAGKCAEISSTANSPPVPFSILFSIGRAYFDEEGNYIPSSLGEGLTCATFVMAIFQQLGIPLLLSDDWETEGEDVAWHVQIVAAMRSGAPDQNHFDAMAANVGCARYRPADVVIASSKKTGRPLRQSEVRKAYGALHRKVSQLSA